MTHKPYQVRLYESKYGLTAKYGKQELFFQNPAEAGYNPENPQAFARMLHGSGAFKLKAKRRPSNYGLWSKAR